MSPSSERGLLAELPLLRRGKVRNLYDLGETILIVASDRISAFDVVLPTTIPGKGRLLTTISRFWFERTAATIPNHLVSDRLAEMPAFLRPYADELAGRTMLARKAERIDVECVVRGYLAGSGWSEYARRGTLGGEPLPAELPRAGRLAEPRFTPAWKRDDGHDEAISRDELRRRIGTELAGRLEEVSLRLYRLAAERCSARGLILADTKFEFGWIAGELTLIDEALTPDSSRYWDQATYRPGEEPVGFDKQPLRDWLTRSGWDKRPPGPTLPPAVVVDLLDRYGTVERRLTGDQANGRPPSEAGSER